jgi:hypothetical protein
MTEKKENTINIKVAYALGLITMLMFTGIIVVFAYYSAAVTQRDSLIAAKDSEIQDLQNDISTLQDQVSSLQTQVEAQQNQILTLQNQLSSPNSQAARIINVGLGAADNPYASQPYLHVSGYVCNVGTETAYNVKLHVTANQGSVVAIDQYLNIGTIGKQDSKEVNNNFYYSGPALTQNSWTMTPEWTTSS